MDMIPNKKNRADGNFTAGVNVDVNITTQTLIEAASVIMVAATLLILIKLILQKVIK